jgi:hypothetical protein
MYGIIMTKSRFIYLENHNIGVKSILGMQVKGKVVSVLN